MREVPGLFFREDFDISRPEVYREVCPGATEEARHEAAAALSEHVNSIEIHLMKEIGVSSDMFFKAVDKLQELSGMLEHAHAKTKALRLLVQLFETVH